VTAATHLHRPNHSRVLLALGLPTVIGLAVLAAPKLESEIVPEPARSNMASCETDQTVPPTPASRPPAHERGLHRVNSPIPALAPVTTSPTGHDRLVIGP
jgi:hypothetical protein